MLATSTLLKKPKKSSRVSSVVVFDKFSTLTVYSPTDDLMELSPWSFTVSFPPFSMVPFNSLALLSLLPPGNNN